ncbi:MAG: (4Fe-4S)-binding protein [Chloroflexota bacterium]
MSDAPQPLAPTGRHYASDGIEVWYDPRRCRHAGECVRGDGAVFETGRKPWIRPELGDAAHIAEVIRRCPTGALHYRIADGPEEPPEVPTAITQRPEGAFWIRGDLRLATPDGEIAERRAALCGCGRTENRPFCDGVCTRVAR